jgi:hypothetical protein
MYVTGFSQDQARSIRKSPDGYTVLGPWMVTADEMGDPAALDFGLSVNGHVRQRSNTAEMTVGLKRLIAIASSWYTLHPGDVIPTGTPECVGPVAPDDVMEACIDGSGRMRVAVRQASPVLPRDPPFHRAHQDVDQRNAFIDVMAGIPVIGVFLHPAKFVVDQLGDAVDDPGMAP